MNTISMTIALFPEIIDGSHLLLKVIDWRPPFTPPFIIVLGEL